MSQRYEDHSTHNDGKFSNTKYRDWIFSVLFVIHLGGIIALWIMGLVHGAEDKSDEEIQKELLPADSSTFKTLLVICAGTIGAGYSEPI